jgi:hypothetical protein
VKSFYRRFLRFIPCRYQPYSHLFIENGEIESRIHIHNFLSIIWPEGQPSAMFVLTLKDTYGRELAQELVVVRPFNVFSDSIRNVFSNIDNFPSYGTLTVRLKADQRVRKYARSCSQGLVYFPSPFWMQYSSTSGSQAYVHSVGSEHTNPSRFDLLLNKLTNEKHVGPVWESGRVFEMHPKDSIDIYVLNQSSKRLSQNLKILNTDDVLVFSGTEFVDAGGVRCFSFFFDMPESIYLRIENLSNSNSKPYILIRSNNDKFALTHG